MHVEDVWESLTERLAEERCPLPDRAGAGGVVKVLLADGIGAFVWICLSGPAAPRLPFQNRE